MSSVTARILQNVLSPSVRHLPLVLLALLTFDLRELLEYPLIRQFSHVQVWFLLLLNFHVQQFQLVRVSVCDSLQTVLVSASSSEASVSQSGRTLVPVSGVSVPVLSVSVDEGVYVPAAPSAPVCIPVFRFKFLDCKIPVSSFRLPVSYPVKVQVQVQVLMYQCVLFPNFASLLFPLLVTSPCVLVGHFVTLIMSSCTNVCMRLVS